MSALTIRLPDDKHERLKELSRRRGTSVNRLIDEMTTLMLAEFDAETRFLLRAKRGRARTTRGLELLRKAGKK
jgi:predicted DNA-binding protein